MKNKRGQVIAEGLTALGAIFLVFLLVLVIYIYKSADVVNSSEQVEERAECLKLANIISGIYSSGDGSTMQIMVYRNLTVFPVDQRIETKNSFCTYSVRNVTYTDQSLIMINLTNQVYTVENKNNIVDLSIT